MISALITVAEAAQLKGVSRTTIYNAIKDGRLKSQKILGHVALVRSEVERWQPSPQTGWPKGKRVSEEAKSKISQTQKQRWVTRKTKI
jgi:excisionase family DNA binding protein